MRSFWSYSTESHSVSLSTVQGCIKGATSSWQRAWLQQFWNTLCHCSLCLTVHSVSLFTLQVCIKGGEVQLAEGVVATAKALGGPASPNCHVYTSLVQGYCQGWAEAGSPQLDSGRLRKKANEGYSDTCFRIGD